MSTNNNKKDTKSLAEYLNSISEHVDEFGFGNLDDKTSKACSHCASVLKLKKSQVELLAVVMDMCMFRKPVTLAKIMKDLDGKSDNLKVLSLKDDLDLLVQRRLLYYNPDECILDAYIYVPENVINDIANSKKPAEYTYKATTMRQFGENIGEFLNHHRNRTFDPNLFAHMMNVLFEDNPDNPIVKAYRKHDLHLKPFEMIVWGYMLQQNLLYAKTEFSLPELCDVLNFAYPILAKAIKMGRQTFETEDKGLMEFGDKPDRLRFTSLAIQDFLDGLPQEDENDEEDVIHIDEDDDDDMFGNIGGPDRRKNCGYTLIKSDTIEQKQLFYNKEDAAVLDELKKLLSAEQYPQVKERMAHSGLKTGLNILLFGSPGTGKTEFVNQLSLGCHRDLMRADFSQLKNKYVGESEKAIKRLFDSYRTCVEESDQVPILLINECDGLLGRRVAVESSSDMHSNSAQTLLLEALENQPGIVICTSNNPENMDPAFERRFLYRLEIHRPDENSRREIWRSLCPDLKKDEIEELARYEMSGGQIENVSRQRSIWTVLHGEEPPLADIKARCETEIKSYMNKTAGKNKIGFC